MEKLTEKQATDQMVKNNDRIIRVLKRGFYPASVAGDVQGSIDYLTQINRNLKFQVKIVKEKPSETTTESPTK